MADISQIIPRELIAGASPSIDFTEDDQTFPAGLWRIVLSGDKLIIRRATAADWSTSEDWMVFDKALNAVTVKAMSLTAAPATDHTFSGNAITATAGEALALFEACYLKSDGKMWKAKADAATTMPAVYLAAAAIDADASGTFIGPLSIVRDDSWTWTPGALLYVSEATAGLITATAPATSGNQVQIIGVAISADVLLFFPNMMLVEVV